MKSKSSKKQKSNIEDKKENEKSFWGVNFLYCVCFFSGLFIMTIEMLGFRLLAPYFGYSMYVWGSLIGIIMAALSAGYLIGGSLADRYPKRELLYFMIFLAGLYEGIISFIYRPLLLFSRGQGLIFGSITATILLFGIPMILLSTVSPFIIRLLAEEKKIGITAGKIYSISTVGSIFGTFLSSFYLIPSFGSHKTLLISVAGLLLIGIAGLASRRKALFLLLLFFLPLAFNYCDLPYGKNTVFVKESPYSHIEVVKLGEWLALKPQDNFYHSLYHPRHIMTGNEWDYYCLAPVVQHKSQEVLILGMGGGTSVRQFLHFWPQMHIDALDIDPVVADVATELFEIPKDNPKLNIIIGDARAFLQNNSKKYDFIQIDIFRGGVFIPFYLATEEFFTLCREDLGENGLIIMNVNIPVEGENMGSDGPTLFGCMGNTISKIFPSVFYVALDTGNAVFLAFREEISLTDLKKRLSIMNIDDKDLKKLVFYSKDNIEEYAVDSNSFVLTDDYSPVDELTYPIAAALFNDKGDKMK